MLGVDSRGRLIDGTFFLFFGGLSCWPWLSEHLRIRVQFVDDVRRALIYAFCLDAGLLKDRADASD
jgi:hypothetical protein